MLSRTADSLYWLARYIERTENIARLVQVGHRMASTAGSLGSPGNEWHSTLVAAGCAPGFYAKHGEARTAAVIDYLVRDPDNPSSILSCFETARRNARAVRTALTADMWDALNETWLRARGVGPDSVTPERVSEFLDWVKERSLLFSGAYANTMLRNDAYYFTRLGTFLERADNTARILDVKYYVLLPHNELVGGEIDSAQWAAILRSVSAHRSYRWVYRESYKPWRIADYLILNRQMPRSLRSCYDEIESALVALGRFYGASNGCQSLAQETLRLLEEGDMNAIFQSGLHEFLAEFIARNNRPGSEISSTYHFTD